MCVRADGNTWDRHWGRWGVSLAVPPMLSTVAGGGHPRGPIVHLLPRACRCPARGRRSSKCCGDGLNPPLLRGGQSARTVPTPAPSWLAALSAPAGPPLGDFTHPLHPGLLFTSVVDEDTTQQVWSASRIGGNRRLYELLFCPRFSHDALIPALTMTWDTSRPWRPRTGGQREAPTDVGRYFLGEESGYAFEPALWGLAGRPAHEFVVREAADRLTCLAALQAGVTGAPGHPARPAIWEGDTFPGRYGSRTLATTEQGWVLFFFFFWERSCYILV